MPDKRWGAMAMLQLLGLPVALVTQWLLFVRADLPTIPTTVNVVVVVGIVVVGVLLVAVSWSRLGGYGAYRSLRRWVRDGPDPTGVDPAVRMRFLRSQLSGSGGIGWVYVGLSALWLVFALVAVTDDRPAAALLLATAAVWAVVGTRSIAVGRRWGGRVRELVAATEAPLVT